MVGSTYEADRSFPHGPSLQLVGVRGGQDQLVPNSTFAKLIWQKGFLQRKWRGGDVIWKEGRSDEGTA
jgi:hypothetical protein